MITPVTAYALAHAEDEGGTPPPPPPPPTAQPVMIWRHLFDQPWYDDANKQIPNGWLYGVTEGDNPYGDGQPWNRFVDPEWRHIFLSDDPEGWAARGEAHFFNETGSTFKMFSGPPWNGWVGKPTTLHAGRWRIVCSVVGDCYNWTGQKTRVGDPQHARGWLFIGDYAKPIQFDNLGENIISADFDVLTDGQYTVGMHWVFVYAASNNGLFVRELSLYELPNEPPQPPPPPPAPRYKVVVNLLPQSATTAEGVHVLNATWQNRETVLFSHDDAIRLVVGGRSDSFIRLWERDRFNPDQLAAIAASGVNVVDEHFPAPPPPPPPPDRVSLPVTPLSQRNPAWANEELGPEGTGETIGHWGCLLVDYNMMAQYLKLATDNPPAFNARFVEAGCFSGRAINAYALRTAFPGQVTGGSWLDAGPIADARIRASIDAGIPVPVEVDFNPDPDRDQHWVLIVGYDGDGFIMADPWHGDVLSLSLRYGQYIQAIFYGLVGVVSKIDMLPYFRGAGNVDEQCVLQYSWNGGGTQRLQIQWDLPKQDYYVVKDGQWEKWHYTFGSGGNIYLDRDTSQDNDHYYRLLQPDGSGLAVWCPRYMAVGESYTRRVMVVHYRKSDCVEVGRDNVAESTITLDYAGPWTAPGGLHYPNVVRLHTDVYDETYILAYGKGLRGFQFPGGESHVVEEYPTGREPLTRRVIPCIED